MIRHTTPQPTAPDSSSSSSLGFTTHLTPAYPHPILTPTDLAHCSSNYVMSLVSVLHTLEPSTYAQAQQHLEWVKAMEQQLLALETNGTWVLTSLPHGKKALTSKWVYKTKFRPDGFC